jgi:hypothetical protein
MTASYILQSQRARKIAFVGFFLVKILQSPTAVETMLGFDHVVLLLALIKLDYNLTSTSSPSSSGLKGRRRTYLTIFKRAWSAHSKMVR